MSARRPAGREDRRTAGEEVERERLLDLLGADGDDDRVSSVVPAGAARADVEVGGEDVDELAFALVAPLRPEHDGDCITSAR